jgi:hypothetical protein
MDQDVAEDEEMLEQVAYETETRRLGDLFIAHPDWYQYTSQKYQRRELTGYYPSRYVMIDFSHIVDEAHVTFYPASPEHDDLSVECNDWFMEGWTDWQINQKLAEEGVFLRIADMEICEFHVTFRIQKRREHAFYNVRGGFLRQTENLTEEYRRIADEIAVTIGKALLIGSNVWTSALFKLLEDVTAYVAPYPTALLGFTLKKGATVRVSAYDQGYYRVTLMSGWATYHCKGSPTVTVYPQTLNIPAMYVEAGIFETRLVRPAG